MLESYRTYINRLRRLATRQRLTLRKSRIRDKPFGDGGIYRLVDHCEVVFEASRATPVVAIGTIEAYLVDKTRLPFRTAHRGGCRWHASLADL